MIDCLKCVNSACCKLDVEVNKNEYERLEALGLKDYFITRLEVFLKKEKRYTKHKEVFNEMYKDNFAILKKGNDGNCVLLDSKTMKCTIYEDRPKVCKDYTFDRCINIRELKN